MMGNDIELFDRYIADSLSAEEKQSFDHRLRTDADFRLDFKVYMMVVRGICQEAEQDNFEFGHAMKKLSGAELLKIIGRSEKPRVLRLGYLRERMAWIASIAAVMVIGITIIFNLRSDFRRTISENQRVAAFEMDNTVFAYNYVPSTDRLTGKTIDISEYDNDRLTALLPSLKRKYAEAPDDDIQARQDAGMRLAMVYLKLHDRKMAIKTLNELKDRFSDDEIFVAQCDRILSQIK